MINRCKSNPCCGDQTYCTQEYIAPPVKVGRDDLPNLTRGSRIRVGRVWETVNGFALMVHPGGARTGSVFIDGPVPGAMRSPMGWKVDYATIEEVAP